ncbi:MAG: CoA transferase [Deltaproteobacteria bacterium]|nr:CoA transferase [Deltaproteobacteria bacterium]
MPTNGGSRPLAGIRIIDLSNMISGPLATMILGDQGADVIKVEAPGMGDPMRMFGAMRGGMSSTFVNLNRSKRSIVIDLRGETGKEILRRLIRKADVFVQNFRPGVVERLGFGHDAVRALAADVVYASISGFGDTGPFSHRPVYDNVVQALSGVTAVQADPDTGKPELVRNLTLDKATAYTVAQAVTAALLARARGRGGQYVRVAMLDAAIAFLWPDGMMNHTFLGDDVFRVPPIATIYRIYPTADGSITVAALTDDQWARTCRATDREDLIEDPRFRSIFDRLTHMQELREIVTDIIATRTTAEWCALSRSTTFLTPPSCPWTTCPSTRRCGRTARWWKPSTRRRVRCGRRFPPPGSTPRLPSPIDQRPPTANTRIKCWARLATAERKSRRYERAGPWRRTIGDTVNPRGNA